MTTPRIDFSCHQAVQMRRTADLVAVALQHNANAVFSGEFETILVGVMAETHSTVMSVTIDRVQLTVVRPMRLQYRDAPREYVVSEHNGDSTLQ